MTKMPIAVLGIDLGKNSCSVAGLDMHGAVVLRRRMTRESLVVRIPEQVGQAFRNHVGR
jgi:transposase